MPEKNIDLVGAHSIFSLRFAGIVPYTKFNQLSSFFSTTLKGSSCKELISVST